ncbi:hypothetical protein, partial [Sedimenticola hydrogenitrophicus]|uniref:hypothetical protein n=1 Tax=Sedimenticola hydrogenitrophicus TaxID=2967975 RepID=UPI002FF793D0
MKTQSLNKPIPLALRPDKSRVVIGTANNGEDLILYVNSDRPDAWKQKGFSEFIAVMKTKGITVSVCCGQNIKEI